MHEEKNRRGRRKEIGRKNCLRSCSSPSSCCSCGATKRCTKRQKSCSKNRCCSCPDKDKKRQKPCSKNRCCPCTGPPSRPTVYVSTTARQSTATTPGPPSRPTVHVSTTTRKSTATTPGGTFNNRPMRQNNSAGSIAGGVIGTLLTVELGALILVVWWRKRKRNNRRDVEGGGNKAGLKNGDLEDSLEQHLYYSIDDAVGHGNQIGLPQSGPHGQDHVNSSTKQDAGLDGELSNSFKSGLSQKGQAFKLPDAYDHLSRMKTTRGQNETLSGRTTESTVRDEEQNFQDKMGYFVLEKDFTGTKTVLEQNDALGKKGQAIRLPNTYDHLSGIDTTPEQNDAQIQEGQDMKLPDTYDHLSGMKTTSGQNTTPSESTRASTLRDEEQTFQHDRGYFVLEKDFTYTDIAGDAQLNTNQSLEHWVEPAEQADNSSTYSKLNVP